MGDDGQVDLYGDDGIVLLDEDGRVKIDGTCCECRVSFEMDDLLNGTPYDVLFTLTGALAVCEHGGEGGSIYYLYAIESGPVAILYTSDAGECHHRLSPRVNGQQVPWDSELAELIDTREDPPGQRSDSITLAKGDRLQIYLRNVGGCVDGPHDDSPLRASVIYTNCTTPPADYVEATLCPGQGSPGYRVFVHENDLPDEIGYYLYPDPDGFCWIVDPAAERVCIVPGPGMHRIWPTHDYGSCDDCIDREEDHSSPGDDTPPWGWEDIVPPGFDTYQLLHCGDAAEMGVYVPWPLAGLTLKVLESISGLTAGECYYADDEPVNSTELPPGSLPEFAKQFVAGCSDPACPQPTHYKLTLCGGYTNPPVPSQFIVQEIPEWIEHPIVRLSNGFCYETSETSEPGNDQVEFLEDFLTCEGCVHTSPCSEALCASTQPSAVVSGDHPGWPEDAWGVYEFYSYGGGTTKQWIWRKWVQFDEEEGDYMYLDIRCNTDTGLFLAPRLSLYSYWEEAETHEAYCSSSHIINGSGKHTDQYGWWSCTFGG